MPAATRLTSDAGPPSGGGVGDDICRRLSPKQKRVQLFFDKDREKKKKKKKKKKKRHARSLVLIVRV